SGLPRKRYTASHARLIALNSMCATACTRAARPSALPSPRCGSLRALTSSGFDGRPGGPIGSGGGELGSARSSPARKACQVSWVRRSLSDGSVASRQRLAAAWRSVMGFGRSPLAGDAPVLIFARASRATASPASGLLRRMGSDSDHASRGLGIVRAQHLHLLQVLVVQPGDVFAGEARGVEVGELLVAFLHRPFEILEILVDQPVGA